MNEIIVAVCAASGGATVGVLTGAMFAGGKIKDLELAYSELSGPVRRFLHDHPIVENVEPRPVSAQELIVLRKALDASQRLMCL